MFKKSGKTGVIYSALLGSLLLMPTQALTQGDRVIEEIMVTATKREERLQDIPMAVSVSKKKFNLEELRIHTILLEEQLD